MKRCVCALVLTTAILLQTSCGIYVPTAVGNEKPRREIIIDPGHGGIDGGAVGISGAIEKDVNLDLSLDLKCLLVFMGYDVIMTRETDVSIHDSDATTIRQKKSSDLRNRLKIANHHSGAVYLSIHQNNFHDSSQDGMCFYYSPNAPSSKQLAECLQSSMLTYLQPNNRRRLKEASKSLFIMFNAVNPAVLVECGFLSNAKEEQMLCTAEYRLQIALTILAGLSFAGM